MFRLAIQRLKVASFYSQPIYLCVTIYIKILSPHDLRISVISNFKLDALSNIFIVIFSTGVNTANNNENKVRAFKETISSTSVLNDPLKTINGRKSTRSLLSMKVYFSNVSLEND